MKGSAKLSYCAESVRYTTSSPSPKMMIALPLASTSSSASPVQLKVMPCSMFCLASSSIAASPWLELYPGAAAPSISAERNKL